MWNFFGCLKLGMMGLVSFHCLLSDCSVLRGRQLFGQASIKADHRQPPTKFPGWLLEAWGPMDSLLVQLRYIMN